jgi:hypothetical protein
VNRKRWAACWTAVFVAVSAAASSPLARGSSLDTEMKVLAGQVKRELADRSNSVAVGEFVSADKSSTGGPRIVQALKAELEKQGVVVDRGASVTVNGKFGPALDAASGKAALRITAKLVESGTGKQVVEFRPRGLFELAEIAAVTGVVMSTPAADSKTEREQTIAESLDKPPSPAVKGTRVSAKKDSPYGVEILVGADPSPAAPDVNRYKPAAPAMNDSGQAVIPIKKGQVYAVKLVNDSKHDAAVQLTIDGLNVFSFSDHKDYTVVIVPAGSAGIIPGWHRTNEISDAFQVSEYAKSAAAKALASKESTGTIVAVFKAAWPQDGAPPADEPSAPRDGDPKSRDGEATARGQSISARFSEVVRSVGVVRESISVRYNKSMDPTDLPLSSPGK